MPDGNITVNVSIPNPEPIAVRLSSDGTELIAFNVERNSARDVLTAEAWAVGEKGGIPVSSDDITFENNAKWYAEDMARIMNNVRIICYTVCETAGNVQVKSVTVDNFRLTVGSWVVVRFTHDNTVRAAKLNVNGTGAKWIKYNNRTMGKADLNTRQTYLFIYDGTDYQLVGMAEIGRVSGAAIGYKSIGFGDDVEASGSYTAAFGKQTRSRDQYATSIGVANHDTRGEDYDRTRSYSTGNIVRVADGYEFSDGTALMIYGEWYFEAKKDVPAGQEPVNDIGTVNSTYWKRIPKLLFTVGNGKDEDSMDEIEPGVEYPIRRNALGLDENGNAYFDGEVYVNSDARSTSGTKLVTSTELNDLIGAKSGLATLDSSGKIPASQLPSYVDDVLEYADRNSFPATGESGKIYVAVDTGKVYRWASTDYAVISDYVHPAYTVRTGKPTANQTPAFGGTVTISQVKSDATGHVTAMTDRTITIPNAEATTSGAGLMSATDKTKLDGIAEGAQVNPTFSVVTGKPTANQTPGFGSTFTVSQIKQAATGQISATDRTVKIPDTVATTGSAGLMSAADKTKLDGIAEGAQVNPTYSEVTGKPTGNQTPAFGSTFTISQVKQVASGQIFATDRTVKIPDTVATTGSAGLMSAADKTKLDGIAAGAAAIDDTAGDGGTTVVWSADKTYDQLATKAPTQSPVFTGTVSLETSGTGLRYNSTNECFEFVFA